MRAATVEQALKHPNWSMGPKITIDSATLMNKGLELIEAHHLFALEPAQIDVLVHPQSIVHGLVEYRDGSVIAQLGSPDMRIPIAHCLAWPARIDGPAARLDLAKSATLTFEAPDPDRFPALALGRRALETGGAAPDRPQCRQRGRGRGLPRPRLGFGGLPPWWRPRWRRPSAAMPLRNRKISTRRSPLTIWQGRWRMTSCPKLPQRHPRKSGWGGSASGRGRGRNGRFSAISGFGARGWTGWIIPFLFGLSVVVFFHELGHFLVARWCGVRVLTFSVGFGPELLGFTDRHGTRWKLSAIPLGGYVKFFGDENAASVPDQAAVASMTADERRQSFFHQAGRPARGDRGGRADRQFHPGDRDFRRVFAVYGKQTTTARVDAVQPDPPRPRRGFQPGDVVLAIDGRKVESFSDMQRIVSANAGRTLTFQVDRGGAPVTLTRDARAQAGQGRLRQHTCHAVLGVSRSMSPADVKTETVDPLAAVWLGAKETWFIIDRTFSYIGGLFAGPRMRRPARRADPDRPDFGPGRHAWASCRCCTSPPCCRSRSGC